MNIVSVKIAADGYRVEHLVDTNLGRQTWTTYVPQDDREIAKWIAVGNTPAPADAVPVAALDPVLVLTQALKDKATVLLTDADIEQAAVKVAAGP